MARLSASLGLLWPDRPLIERVTAAADAGFAAVELHWPWDTPARTLGAACRDRGLALVSLNTPLGGTGDFGLAALPGRAAEFRAGFSQAAGYAHEAGCAMIHVLAGLAPDDPAHEATLIENLDWAAAQAPDLTLLLEPMNRRDRPGYFYSRPARAVALLDRLDRANLGLMLDAYHAGLEGLDPLAEAAAFLPRLRHVQIARVPDRREPDRETATAFLDGLDRLGYAGWIGAEYTPAGPTESGLGWAGSLLSPARSPA